MVVAFDFDGVADDNKVQKLIRKLIVTGNEVWIVTMRKENEFNKNIVNAVISKLGMTIYSVIFCNDKPKLEMIKMLNADLYIDNNDFEFSEIMNYSMTIPLLFKK